MAPTWIIIVVSALVVVATAWFARRGRTSPGRLVVIPLLGMLTVAAVAAVVLLLSGNDDSSKMQAAEIQQCRPRIDKRDVFAGSASCQECHPKQYDTWHHSFHRTMTQLPTPQAVRGDFDNVELDCNGESYRLETDGENFFVMMPDPDIDALRMENGFDARRGEDRQLVRKQVALVTGSHHFQVYWVTSPDQHGLRQMPWYYFIQEKAWLPGIFTVLRPLPPNYSVQAVASGFWNGICIKCHTVGGIPDIDPQTRQHSSRVAELGISCEACHGVAAAHVRFHQGSKANRSATASLGDEAELVNPAKADPKIASEICAQCHSAFVPANLIDYERHGLEYRAGGDIRRSHRFLSYSDPALSTLQPDAETHFWKDGTCRVGGDEYNGLSISACFTRAEPGHEISCLSCHSMHNYQDHDDQLLPQMESNEACLNCHSDFRDKLEQHTHHPAESSGSLCYNCHMPYTSFALLKGIRSHRIDNPDVATSSRTGRPNACNLCHLDKTLAWTAEHQSEWYGTPIPMLEDDEKKIAGSLLWLLRGNAVQRIITAWHMGWSDAQEASGKSWIAAHLSQLLLDPYSAVRYVSHRSLQSLPGFADFQYDFVGPAEARRTKSEYALHNWLLHRGADNRQWNEQVLIDPNGKRMQGTVERLLRQRDDTPVAIPE